jgi:hypothetical protein
MTSYVFAGPTLASAEVQAACGAICLPPVALGDVYQIAQKRPEAIGIIDGYFDGVPAVWHKEILWAMAEGVHVFGCASMGALRAAELHDFGMRGVGRIFEWYRDGTLEDDDEVAVLHGPKETGYVALSEPMVNIRATLEKAIEQRVIGPGTRQALEALAKSLFYQQRSWEALFDHPDAKALPAAERAAVQAWLPQGRVDAKRDDALAMLAAMDELLTGGPEAKRVTYHLEWTEMWDEAVSFSSAAGAALVDESDIVAHDRVLDELRLDVDAYHQARDSAFLRVLAQREADRRRLTVDPAALSDTTNRFRMKHQLLTTAALESWIAENEIDRDSFDRLMADEVRLEVLGSSTEPALCRQLWSELRRSGDFSRLSARARQKQRVLNTLGIEGPEPGSLGPGPPALRAWFFENRLGLPLPDDLDRFAQRLGFANRTDFDRALLREYVYLQHKEQRDPDLS